MWRFAVESIACYICDCDCDLILRRLTIWSNNNKRVVPVATLISTVTCGVTEFGLDLLIVAWRQSTVVLLTINDNHGRASRHLRNRMRIARRHV